MDKLRRYRRVLRAAATRILASTSELWQDSEPAASDLLVAIDDLEEKDATLNGLNATIADHLDGKEFEDEISSALKYHVKIRNAATKLRYILEEKYGLHAEKTVRVVPLPTYLIEALKLDCVLSSTEDLGKTQTNSVELNVTQGPEQTRTEPPTCRFEFIAVPDFMKGDPLREPPETRLAQIVEFVWDVAPTGESESLPIHEVGKAEIPLVKASASCDETARPNQESAEPNIELTSTSSIKSTAPETTEIETRRKHMTDQRNSFNSEHNNYRKEANPSPVLGDRFRYPFTNHAGRTGWFRRKPLWRRMALLKPKRRLKHRWKLKR